MTTRTAVLGVGQVAAGGGSVTLGTVPAGETWILKSVLAYNAGAASDSPLFFMFDHVSGLNAYLPTSSIATGGTFRFDGWVVLAPGDALGLLQNTTAWRVRASGTRLLGHV